MVEISAVAEGVSAVRAAKLALAKKRLALDAKSEAVGQSMAKGLQYVLGIMILLTTVQLQSETRSWCVCRAAIDHHSRSAARHARGSCARCDTRRARLRGGGAD